MLELNHLYMFGDLPRCVIENLGHRFIQRPLPTETVVTGFGEVVIPLVKRTYVTCLYFLRGKVVGYNELLKEPDFRDTSNYDSILMEEVWEDYGDDGHIEYILMGYKFVVEGVNNEQP